MRMHPSLPTPTPKVYPGLGWVMWRSRAHLPESLVFHDAYLGKDQITITLNFSKGTRARLNLQGAPGMRARARRAGRRGGAGGGGGAAPH